MEQGLHEGKGPPDIQADEREGEQAENLGGDWISQES